MVEGNLDAKDAGAVLPGMKVLVEPTMPTGPDTKYGNASHRLEVTGVGVTAHPGRPMVVSSSADGTVGVWDLMAPEGKPRGQYRLPHPVGVRSLAVTGPKFAPKFWVATGCDDGRLRLWDVTNPEKISDKPAKEFEEAHASAVMAMAFSPDGKFLATAAGREVWVWNVADSKKMYALPGEHKDAVTSVRFTPQGTLVTVARDKAVRIWTVGDKGAAVAKTLDHRKGNVDTLTVSRDGGRILFDQDDGRLEVVSLADGRVLSTVQNAAAAARFATFATFSADDSLILTAAADGEAKGELQLWNTPPMGGRASERRRLVTPYRAAPTCAAFSQDGDKKFVVVGTQTGGVHIWAKPTNEVVREQVGTVASLIRLDAKTVKIQVKTSGLSADVGNLLLDKGAATIIIKPGDPVPPPANTTGRTAEVPAPNGVIPAGGFAPMGEVIPAAVVAPVVAPPTTNTMPQVLQPSPSLLVPTPAPQTSNPIPTPNPMK
ncbi:MAG: WD40 repeat domain-containing protein, partial [Gemmataceae bacterium]